MTMDSFLLVLLAVRAISLKRTEGDALGEMLVCETVGDCGLDPASLAAEVRGEESFVRSRTRLDWRVAGLDSGVKA
jgi:hypothetical protein